MVYSKSVTHLIEELARLPGVGGRSAQRIAFHLLRQPEERTLALAQAITAARQNSRQCEKCCNITDEPVCHVCSSDRRDAKTIMVVEDPRDLAAYEKTKEYHGLYHVLHGAISPMNGVGPGELRMKELLARIASDEPAEIILATNANVEGEATAMYLAKLLKPLGVKITRIASGVPMGGELEYVDEVTLSRALEGRIEV